MSLLLDIEQASSQADDDGMGPVVCLQFIHDVFDVEVDGCFGDREEVGDLLIAMAVANEAQHFELAWTQSFLSEVLRDDPGDVWRYVSLTGGHGANDF